jgi:mannose-6-phosphate isomerase-like protein (cupin superfamily)
MASGCAGVAAGGASSRRSTAARLPPGTRWPYTSTVTWIELWPILFLDVGETFRLLDEQRHTFASSSRRQRRQAAARGRAGGAGGAAPTPTPCGRQMATPPTGATPGGITHDSQTEGYYIVSGGGTMFTEGYIVNGRPNPSPDLNGPTGSGVAMDVVKKTVKPGDIIIIPAGVVLGWLDIPDHVDYLSFRPSPGILNAGFVHPVLKK